jgi:hypothetical protein
MELKNIWSQIRGILRKEYSFSEIKEIGGKAGLPVFEIHKIQQKYKGGNSKGQLMDALDGLFAEENSDSQNRIVKNVLKEICTSKPELKKEVEQTIRTTGWAISDKCEPFPLRMQIRLLKPENDIVSEGIEKAMARYRDGDFPGAITSICGIIDKLTKEIFEAKDLGDCMSIPFQARVSNSVKVYDADYKTFMNKNGISDQSEQTKVWNNYKKSISNSAYVLGAFRREYSDAHGKFKHGIDANIIINALDIANYIFSSLINLKEKNFT